MKCPKQIKEWLIKAGMWGEFEEVVSDKTTRLKRINANDPIGKATEEAIDYFLPRLRMGVEPPPTHDPHETRDSAEADETLKKAPLLEDCRPEGRESGSIDVDAAVLWAAEAAGQIEAGVNPGAAPNGTAFNLLSFAIADKQAFLMMWKQVAKSTAELAARRDDDGREIFKLIKEFYKDEERRRGLPEKCVLKVAELDPGPPDGFEELGKGKEDDEEEDGE